MILATEPPLSIDTKNLCMCTSGTNDVRVTILIVVENEADFQIFAKSPKSMQFWCECFFFFANYEKKWQL